VGSGESVSGSRTNAREGLVPLEEGADLVSTRAAIDLGLRSGTFLVRFGFVNVGNKASTQGN